MNRSLKPPRSGIDGGVLKLIAIVSMLIDHIGVAIIEVGLMSGMIPGAFDSTIATEYGERLFIIDMLFRTIGRLAFPIFCFLLVQGYLHTRNFRRYLTSMAVFALISEIPFDLAVSSIWFNPLGQNVYFTLAIGLLVLRGLAYFDKRPVLQCLCVFMGAYFSYVLHTDYAVIGILLIVCMFLFRNKKPAFYLTAGYFTFVSSTSCYGAAALSLIPISLYNGQRGRLKLKYFFYCFYPAHLLLLYLIRCVLLI